MTAGAAAATRVVLPEREWRDRRAAHEARVDAWTAPRLSRRARGEAHPVDDFLFDYYPHRPAQLRRWHPGYGVSLAGEADAWLAFRGYERTPEGVTVSEAMLADRRAPTDRITALLRAVQGRPPRFGCFGLHEWAMVYRATPAQVRHASWPLRLTPDEIADVVQEQGLRCTHFDAYRFYTPAAAPLNERRLTRASQPEVEQGGCLHATMDLYRWAYTLTPLVPSDLVADCFALAREVRAVDMRAAPYDLRGLGYEPIRVETPEGRAQFATEQRRLAGRGEALRSRLLSLLEDLVAPGS